MKLNSLKTLTILIGFSSLSASADFTASGYTCTDYQNESHLTVREHHNTRVGNSSFTLSTPYESKIFYGILNVEDGGFLTKKTIKIFPYDNDSLTIIERIANCGRGSCDDDSALVISAHLKIGEQSTLFTCQALSPNEAF